MALASLPRWRPGEFDACLCTGLAEGQKGTPMRRASWSLAVYVIVALAGLAAPLAAARAAYYPPAEASPAPAAVLPVPLAHADIAAPPSAPSSLGADVVTTLSGALANPVVRTAAVAPLDAL